ncbi:MAG: hypothetical protein QM704_19400 [Anaeromyxobacteraceae bacterium]
MTGADIVGFTDGEAVVLAVHGAFDGAAAWTLRLRMEELGARRFLVDLHGAEEACDFAAGLLASWSRQHARVTLTFRTADPGHARLLEAHGLEVAQVDPDGLPQRYRHVLLPTPGVQGQRRGRPRARIASPPWTTSISSPEAPRSADAATPSGAPSSARP